MMSGRAKQYLLLLLVAGIWGIIGYRFLSFTDDDGRVAPIRIQTRGEKSLVKSAYQFQLNYPDPFLRSINLEEPLEPEIEEIKKKPQRSFFLKIPEVILRGVVRSKSSKAALIQVNGQQNHMVTEGQEFDGFRVLELSDKEVSLLHISSDSVMVFQVQL